MTKINRDEFADVQAAYQRMLEDYESIKGWLRANSTSDQYATIRRNTLGQLEPGLKSDHDWISDAVGLDQVLEDFRNELDNQDDDETEE